MLQDLFSRRALKSAMPLLRRTRSRLHISLHEAAEDDPAGLCNPVQAESQDYGAPARGSSVALVLARWRGSVFELISGESAPEPLGSQSTETLTQTLEATNANRP